MPIRRSAGAVEDELTRYLSEIGRRCELIVVDGSDPASFDAAHEAWSGLGRHVRPHDAIGGRNGKVRGVLTGVALASHERVVIADDDVRYDALALVGPSGRCATSTWSGRRITLRRSSGTRAGTPRGRCSIGSGSASIGPARSRCVAVRCAAPTATTAMSCSRTWSSSERSRPPEGTCSSPPDLFVRRLPPSTRHFWSQRRRQAYDEFARPWRLGAYLAVLPLVAWALARRRRRQVGLAAVSVVLLAEAGRRRAGGTAVFPRSASLFAPLWVVERSVCSWLALVSWLRGGCPYSGSRLRVAATSRRTLRRRLQAHDDAARVRMPERGWGADGG